MARSSYIYLVREDFGWEYDVLGAFTVKSEAVWWIRSKGLEKEPRVNIWRMGDGIHQDGQQTKIPREKWDK